MTFQFLCPQGHLLQGEEAHQGMQCECPQCGTAFIIPTLGAEEARGPQSHAPAHSVDLDLEPLAPADEMAAAAEREMPEAAGGPLDLGELNIDAGSLGDAVEAESVLHIPCPNGHELETPLDMLGQRVMCPHCGVEFRLRREKSREYQHQQEILDRRRARFWFQLAVLAASFVGVALLFMIIMLVFNSN